MTHIYHSNDGVVGAVKMRDYLKLDPDLKLKVYSITTIRNYMRELGLKSIVRRPKYHYLQGKKHRVFSDLIQRNFIVDGSNKIWVVDFTYLYLKDGTKRYNCTIMDLHRRRVVATLNSHKINAKLAINCLKIALKRFNPPKGVILHSDQGVQFTSRAFVNFCSQNHVQQSMSRAGCPGDNAIMERFFNTFKVEFLNLYEFSTIEQLDKMTYHFILIKYNNQRPHSYNDGIPTAWNTKVA